MPENPFASPGVWPTLDQGSVATLSTLWESRLDSTQRRVFQSALTQDEQQRIMSLVAPHCAKPLTAEAQRRLRRVAHVERHVAVEGALARDSLTPPGQLLAWARVVEHPV